MCTIKSTSAALSSLKVCLGCIHHDYTQKVRMTLFAVVNPAHRQKASGLQGEQVQRSERKRRREEAESKQNDHPHRILELPSRQACTSASPAPFVLAAKVSQLPPHNTHKQTMEELHHWTKNKLEGDSISKDNQKCQHFFKPAMGVEKQNVLCIKTESSAPQQCYLFLQLHL